MLCCQMLRLLDNETIEPEDILEPKELVDDYLLRNQDDFEEFGDPDDLYADLIEQLDNLEVGFPLMPWIHVEIENAESL